MQVRNAESQDFTGILALYQQLNPEDPVVEDGRDRATFDEILSHPNFHLFVATDSDQVVATCYLNLIPNLSRNVSPYGIIENVVTDQNRRNQGLGKRIIAYTLNYAWQAGCYKVMLQTGSRRESTHNFYRACGFTSDGRFAFVARSPASTDVPIGTSSRVQTDTC